MCFSALVDHLKWKGSLLCKYMKYNDLWIDIFYGEDELIIAVSEWVLDVQYFFHFLRFINTIYTTKWQMWRIISVRKEQVTK